MDFLSLASKRRSIRNYLEKPVEPEKVEALVEAALRAPTSRGGSSWRFIVVEDRAMLERASRKLIESKRSKST